MDKSKLSTVAFTLLTAAVLTVAWWQKDEYWYTAERGLGYAFGIVGCSMMVLLLLYPARKHYRPMRNLFKVRHWFRMHMVFGVWGPVFILLHSNFNLGSPNSSIALFSMLLVAGSGIVGRFIYQKLHLGLYGRQIEFSELDGEYQQAKRQFSQLPFYQQKLQTELDAIETTLTRGLVPLRQCLHAKHKLKKLKRTIDSADGSNPKNREELKAWHEGLAKLTDIAGHATYTRLFSLWHFLHFPIFFMMLLTATVHILVVHIY